MKYYLDTKGINYHHSCAYTPQQNGMVERKHCHLLNVGKTLRFQANLLKFWGKSVQIVCYLINRLPTPLLSHKLSYQLLYNKLPSYNHLQTFGCLCYATNLLPTHKFDQRAHCCIFVGYSLGQKGYRVYDLENNKLFSSRDVVFHEHIFSFHNNSQEEQHDVVVLPLPQTSYEPITTKTTKPQADDQSLSPPPLLSSLDYLQ